MFALSAVILCVGIFVGMALYDIASALRDIRDKLK